MTVLLRPVVLKAKAPLPTTVFDVKAPLPRPTVRSLIVASSKEVKDVAVIIPVVLMLMSPNWKKSKALEYLTKSKLSPSKAGSIKVTVLPLRALNSLSVHLTPFK